MGSEHWKGSSEVVVLISSHLHSRTVRTADVTISGYQKIICCAACGRVALVSRPVSRLLDASEARSSCFSHSRGEKPRALVFSTAAAEGSQQRFSSPSRSVVLFLLRRSLPCSGEGFLAHVLVQAPRRERPPPASATWFRASTALSCSESLVSFFLASAVERTFITSGCKFTTVPPFSPKGAPSSLMQ